MKKVKTGNYVGIKLLDLDVALPKTGHIYPTEEVKKMIQRPFVQERFNIHGLYGIITDNPQIFIDHRDIAFITEKLYIKDGALYMDITIANTLCGTNLEKLLDDENKSIEFYAHILGYVDSDNKCYDLELVCTYVSKTLNNL